jgi:streptomycin 6-kinase
MDSPIQQYCRQWRFVPEHEIVTSSGNVWAGTRDNVPVVLKLLPPGSDEGRALEYFAGRGAVRVVKSDDAALLLERLSPGRPLTELTIAGSDEEATRVFCATVRQLHSAHGAFDHFVPISELARGFERYLETGDRRIPRHDVQAAREMYRDLVASQAESVLLHGDLHHDNILYDDARGWVAIDPKGYVGDPVFEAGAWLRNPLQHPDQWVSRGAVERRLAVIHAELGWSKERIARWSYAQAILSAIWCLEVNESPDAPLAIADLLANLV